MNDEPRVPAAPPGASETSLASWRATFISRTARVLVLTGGIPLLLVVISFLPHPAPTHVWVAVGLYLLAVLGAWVTRRTPRLRAIVLLTPLVLVAPFLFVGVGLSASGFLSLTLATVLAGILVGPRAAAGFTVASLLVIAAAATIIVTGVRPIDAQFAVDPMLPQAWYRMGLLWLAITTWIVFTVAWLTSRFEESLRAKDAALERLRAEEGQRLEAERRHHEAERALIESQKRETIGRLAGGIAHDFNNALLVILGWNELLREGSLDDERRRHGHGAIATAGEGAAQLARHLLTIGRRQVAIPVTTQLGPLVEEAARHLERVLPEDIGVKLSLEEVPPVLVDPAQLHQVLLNLALNARDAMPRGGTLTFALRRATSPAGWVELEVGDDGVGMDAATLARAFEPYFTTKEEGHGTGLGLATTHAIITAANGRIHIASTPGHGTRVTIQLPPSGAGAKHEPAPGVEPVASAGRGARVAVVEDDEAARAFMTTALRSGGYEVIEARDGDAALALVERSSAPIDMLCIDGVVPGASTEQVVEMFRSRYPGRPILVCSGQVGSERLRALIENGQLPLLAKPFGPRDLLARVGALLGSAATARPTR